MSIQLDSVTLLVPELELKVLRDVATGGATSVRISTAALVLLSKQLSYMKVHYCTIHTCVSCHDMAACVIMSQRAARGTHHRRT